MKWVNGDQIKVFGTNCAVSTGEYQITEAANQPNVDGSAEESKADALVRMGEVGVQWGSEKTSQFILRRMRRSSITRLAVLLQLQLVFHQHRTMCSMMR